MPESAPIERLVEETFVAERFVPVAVVKAKKLEDKVLVAVVPVAEVKERPLLNVWSPLHVGAIAWDNAGAASLRIKVFAVPFCAERVTETEGFAPVEVL
jgi:hypothetical protein